MTSFAGIGLWSMGNAVMEDVSHLEKSITQQWCTCRRYVITAIVVLLDIGSGIWFE